MGNFAHYPSKRYLALSWQRKKLLCRTCLLFLALRLCMGRVALKKIIRFLSTRGKITNTGNRLCHRDDILWSVQAVGRRMPSGTCLLNALVAEYLFKKNGINSRLFIGVQKKSKNRLAAHAWVTIDEQVVVGDGEDLADYTPLPDSELLKL